MQEQRRHPRRPIEASVICETKSVGRFDGTAKDISLGGVFVEAVTIPEFGTELTLVLTLPDPPASAGPGSSRRLRVNDPLRLPAVVRWATKEGFGVQLGLLGAKETHRLTDFLMRA